MRTDPRLAVKTNQWRLILAICVATLLPLSCGMIFGFYGVDTIFHMSSWVDLARDLHSGVLLPGWAEHANYGLGDVRYVFYPPISLILGTALYSVLPHRFVLGTFYLVALVGAGLAAHVLARRFLSPLRSVLAAALYVSSFFLAITVLKHGAVAELLVDAMLPLIVAAFLDTLKARPTAWQRLSGLLALVWLTDVPLAIAIAYVFYPIAIVLSILRRKGRPVALLTAAMLLSVLLSAIYLLPAFWEESTIRSAAELEFHLRTLFAYHKLLDLTLSFEALCIGAFLAWAFVRLRKQEGQRDLSIVIAMGLIAFLFQLPGTGILWRHAPELRIVGFPHRFQAFLALALPITLFSFRLRRFVLPVVITIYVLLALSPIYSFASWSHREHPDFTAGALVREAMGGYEGAAEYLTRGTGSILYNDPNGPQAEALPQVVVGSGNCTSHVTGWQPEQRAFAVSGTGCIATLKLYAHPFWSTTVDSHPIPLRWNRVGLVTVPVPPGEHQIVVTFHRPLEPMLAGLGVSLCSLLGLFLLFRRAKAQTAGIGTVR